VRKSRLILVFVLIGSSLAFSQKQPLNSEEGSHIARMPSHVWLNDGSAIFYDEKSSESDV